MSKLQAAYLAGLIDGEGYIGILRIKKGQKKHWSSVREIIWTPCLRVAMCNRSIIEWLYKSFGGTFEIRKARGNHQESYGWTLRKFQVIEFLKKIYPHSKVKRKHIELMFQFPRNKSWITITDEMYQKRENLFWELKIINSRKGMAAVETERENSYMEKRQSDTPSNGR